MVEQVSWWRQAKGCKWGPSAPADCPTDGDQGQRVGSLPSSQVLRELGRAPRPNRSPCRQEGGAGERAVQGHSGVPGRAVRLGARDEAYLLRPSRGTIPVHKSVHWTSSENIKLNLNNICLNI